MQRFLVIILLLRAFMNPASGLPCHVDSTDDGNGLFTYTFHRGDDPYVWGLGATYGGVVNGLIALQSYGILGVQEPSGWSHSISDAGLITWLPTNGLTFLDEPLTFSVQSCLAETATYDSWPEQARYPAGFIGGTVYELPGRTNALEGGYQTFIFTGPALPRLAVERIGSNIILRWSTLAQRCRIEACDQPHLHGIWTSVTNATVIVATNFTVTVPATNSFRYFRLVTQAVQIP